MDVTLCNVVKLGFSDNKSFRICIGVEAWYLSPIIKSNLHWDNLDFIIMVIDSHALEKVKNTLFIKNMLQKMYFLSKKNHIKNKGIKFFHA